MNSKPKLEGCQSLDWLNKKRSRKRHSHAIPPIRCLNSNVYSYLSITDRDYEKSDYFSVEHQKLKLVEFQTTLLELNK